MAVAGAPEPVATAPVRARVATLPRVPAWVVQLTLAAAAVGAWQLLAVALADQQVIASPTSTVAALVDGRNAWLQNTRATAAPALEGWAAGSVIGVVLALLAVALPGAERPVLRVAVATYSLPLVAIGPLLQISLEGDGPSVALAALAVVFTTTVALVQGLRSTPSDALDLGRGLGGSPLRILLSVRLRAALPMLLTALRISWPAALTGALIGEYLGSTSGLGAYMIHQQAALGTAEVWASALVIMVVAGAGVAALGAAARLAVLAGAVDVAAVPAARTSSALKRVGYGVGTAVAVSLALSILWIGYLQLFDIDGFVGRTPTDVFDYLLHGADRDALPAALGVTLRDAGIGLVAGWGTGVLMALVFCVSATAARLLMPVAIALRTVPVIAILPLLTMVFGRGLTGTLVVVAMVVFFPTLVLVLDGLRSAPADLLAVTSSYAASRTAVLLRVRLPYALPAAAAGLRIACPAAVLGALLAEWLSSGQGIGYLMLSDSAQSNYDRLWAATVVMTLLAIIAYTLTDAVERAVLSRFRAA